MVLKLEFPGASENDSALPELELEVSSSTQGADVLECRVNLAPYIVSHGKAVDEWHRLYPKSQSGEAGGEIFLRILFQSAQAPMDTWHFNPQQCATNHLIGLNFDHVPSRWFEDINHADIVSKLALLGTTSVRRAEIAFGGIGDGAKPLRLPLDDTGRYALPVKIGKNHLDLIVKAAMRTDHRRIIQIQSPVVVKNDTAEPMQFCCFFAPPSWAPLATRPVCTLTHT